MKLIERYIDEVQAYLPRDLCEEVSVQLRKDLAQRVEQRQAEKGVTSASEVEIEILRELGPPFELADSYVPRPRVLFGPRLYPPFLKTMKIALAILLALAVVGVAVDVADSPSLIGLVRALLSALRSLVTGALVLLGVTVVVFTLIERFGSARGAKRETWDPRRHFEESEDPDRVGYGDAVVSTAFLSVALILVNLFPDKLNAYITLDGESGLAPLLGPAFESLLWLFNLCLLLDLAVEVTALVRRRRSTLLRWAGFAVNGLWVFWLWRLAASPVPIGTDPVTMREQGWSEDAIHRYQEVMQGSLPDILATGLKLGLVAALIGLSIHLFKLLRRTLAL